MCGCECDSEYEVCGTVGKGSFGYALLARLHLHRQNQHQHQPASSTTTATATAVATGKTIKGKRKVNIKEPIKPIKPSLVVLKV